MRTEDGYIIRKCLDGDSAAFGFLVDKYKGSVYAFAYSRLHNIHDAEDVAQEVFIKAYKKLRTLRRWDNFLAWLYSITSNFCKMRIRARARRPDREFVEDQDPKALDRHSMDSYREDLALESLREALNSLPEAQREVLALHYLGGMKIMEVARFLGTSPSTIARRLRGARSQLKEEMLAMMNTAFETQRLQAAFTLRIVEIVKHIRIQPMPRTASLPWGLSLAAGIIFTVISLSPHLRLNPMSVPTGAPLPIKAKMLETGEISVNILEASQIPALASMGGEGGEDPDPSKQKTFLLAPKQDEGGIWTEKDEMSNARARLATCVVDGTIYAIGGFADGTRLSIVEAYDPVKNSWVKKADMPTARYYLSTSVVDGIIYAIGGRLDAPPWSAMATVEAYDPAKNTWKTKTEMPTPRAYAAACVVDGIIYTIGGFQGGNGPGLPTVEAYDPDTDTWETKADMPVGRRFHTASVVDGEIYVIGGCEGDDDWVACEKVAVYDPAKDMWEEMNGTMPSPRADHSASVVNGIIYTFGGAAFPPGNQEGVDIVEAYDPVTDTWETKADMTTARMNLSTSAIDGKIYAIGGCASFNGVSMPIVEVYETGLVPPAQGSGVRPNGKFFKAWGGIKSD